MSKKAAEEGNQNKPQRECGSYEVIYDDRLQVAEYTNIYGDKREGDDSIKERKDGIWFITGIQGGAASDEIFDFIGKKIEFSEEAQEAMRNHVPEKSLDLSDVATLLGL